MTANEKYRLPAKTLSHLLVADGCPGGAVGSDLGESLDVKSFDPHDVGDGNGSSF
ncbi:hypothetical protein GCM10010305_63260 [Streptomyces termitum]|uniref:Uncharacterized protein n=1 Tax=Streptomyces termitum TaxID=67368 RepID=A0A918WEF7_9ACTN|nr:hypothetical protein GCM10010305_63260 [Streptomyces termitum]